MASNSGKQLGLRRPKITSEQKRLDTRQLDRSVSLASAPDGKTSQTSTRSCRLGEVFLTEEGGPGSTREIYDKQKEKYQDESWWITVERYARRDQPDKKQQLLKIILSQTDQTGENHHHPLRPVARAKCFFPHNEWDHAMYFYRSTLQIDIQDIPCKKKVLRPVVELPVPRSLTDHFTTTR